MIDSRKQPYVRMRTIFGESVLPPESAAIVVRAVNRAVAVGDVSRNARWQFVEWMAVEYLHEDRQLRAAQRGESTDDRTVMSMVSPNAMADELRAIFDGERNDDTIEIDLMDLILRVLRSVGYDEACDIMEGIE